MCFEINGYHFPAELCFGNEMLDNYLKDVSEPILNAVSIYEQYESINKIEIFEQLIKSFQVAKKKVQFNSILDDGFEMVLLIRAFYGIIDGHFVKGSKHYKIFSHYFYEMLEHDFGENWRDLLEAQKKYFR